MLRHGGLLSMGWHLRSEDVEWSRELSDIVEHHANVPDDQEAPSVGPQYKQSVTGLFTYLMRQSLEDLLRHASTWSSVATHPDRDRMLDAMRTLGRTLGRTVADGGGVLETPMQTRCYRFRRR